MNQTIAVPKSVFQNLVERINKLESVVLGKKKGRFPAEYVVVSEKAKKRYKKMDEDFKKGRNFKSFNSTEEFFRDLGI